MKKVLWILLLMSTVGAVSAAVVFAMQAADAKRQIAIANANADALRDTVTMYGDSISRTVTLMQTQGEVNGDSITALRASLDAAVTGRDQTLVALNTLRVEFRTLRDEFESVDVVEVPADPDEPDEPPEELGTFQIEGPPIGGDIWVTYRRLTPWSLRTALTVSPFGMLYSVGCDELHRALVNITTPEWVTGTPERGTMGPDVCNAFRPVPFFSFSPDKAIWAVGGGLLGYLLANLVDDGFRVARYEN